MNPTRYALFFAGQLGLMTLLRFFFTWIVRYAGQPVVGESSEALVNVLWVGSVLLGFRLFDGLTDPIAGSISDRWTNRGNERRSLLWVTFFIPPLGLILCFAANLDMGMAVRWALLVTGMFVFFVGYTFYAIPYWSLISDYGEDEHERRVLSNLLGAGMLGATALGSVLSGPTIDRFGYLLAAVAFAVPCSVLMILPYFASPPRKDDAKKAEEAEEPAPDEGLLKAFFSALKHRRFLATLFLFAGSQMSFTVLTTCAVYIVEHVLKSGSPVKDTSLVLGSFLGTSFLAFAAVPYLSRTFGWRRSVIGSSLALGGVYAATALLGQGIIGSPMTTACLVFACGGPMAAIILGMEGEAITDCATELDAGAVSMYFGVFNFVVKALNGVALALSTVLVEQVKPENLGPQGARLMGPVAGGLLVLGVGTYFLLRPKPGSEKPKAPSGEASLSPASGDVKPGVHEAPSDDPSSTA